MPEDKLVLYLSLSAGEADPERLEELTRLMIGELRELGVDSAERPAYSRAEGLIEGEPQTGAKGDPLTIGAILLVALPALLPNLVAFLQSWSLRGENRKVRIKTPAGVEIEFSPEKRLSQAELLALVEALGKIPPSTPAPAKKE